MKTKLIPFVVALFAPWTLSADSAKPNIVFILMHNLRCGEMGCYGGGVLRGAPTPRIDKLATEGTWRTNDQDFDEWYGIPGTTDESMYPSQPGAKALGMPFMHTMEGRKGEQGRELAVYDLDQRRLIDAEITRRAIDFMQRSVRAGKPFYAYVPFTLVHAPALPNPKFAGKTGHGDFADCLAEMDAHVGEILDAVDELKIRENTIFVFTSDNGPDPTAPSQGWSGPWRGYYFTHMEGSLRTPFIVRWPGHVPAGRVSNEIMHEGDTFVTFAKVAGAAVPADRPIDGVDQTDFLLGRTEQSKREGFPVFVADRLEAVKWRHYKLAFYDGQRDWWTPPTRLGVPKIFDLIKDLTEEYGATLPADGWVAGPMMKIIGEFESSLKEFPPIAPGTPDPYGSSSPQVTFPEDSSPDLTAQPQETMNPDPRNHMKQETSAPTPPPPGIVPSCWLRPRLRLAQFTALVLVAAAASVSAQEKKPNILVIMGDDIGWFNPSCYNSGIMGYRTPNIDRIAQEGARFTDWYGQQSCTAGRAAFITGQSPIRTGLTKVGLPGADIGLSAKDPSVAEFLKQLGYATGQFGKNHLGDKDEFLPTAHGFDEFFGNLYHLNAEEEPENPDYPKNPEFRAKFGPRGVLKCTADGKIEDTGPLTKKRMETVDEEFLAGALDFIERQHKASKPFFCYYNSTRMHIFTHLKPESEGKTGLGIYPDGMVEHDGMVGQLLKKLDDLGIAENTIVVYTTDNGAEAFTWPDGGTTPFRGEKATNWEGAFRVPTLIRWPGVIKPATIVNDMCAHEDFVPTFAAAAGESDLVEKAKKGYSANGKQFKVHLDGYNLLPFFKGEAKESPRKEFIYWSDDGDLMAIRLGNWKVAFMEQHAEIMPNTPIGVWQGQFTKLRAPNMYNLRTDPFERSGDSIYKGDWQAKRTFLLVPAQAAAARWLSSFKDFPPRQKPASFNLDEVMQKMTEHPGKQ